MRPKAKVPVGISPRKCCNYDMGHVIILDSSVKLERQRRRPRAKGKGRETDKYTPKVNSSSKARRQDTKSTKAEPKG